MSQSNIETDNIMLSRNKNKTFKNLNPHIMISNTSRDLDNSNPSNKTTHKNIYCSYPCHKSYAHLTARVDSFGSTLPLDLIPTTTSSRNAQDNLKQYQPARGKSTPTLVYSFGEKIQRTNVENSVIKRFRKFSLQMSTCILMIIAFGTIITNAQEQHFDCKHPWVSFHSACYKFQSSAKEIEKAKVKCEEWDSHLVVLDSEEKHEFVTKWLEKNSAANKVWYIMPTKELMASYSSRSDRNEPNIDSDTLSDFWLEDFSTNNTSKPSSFAYSQSSSRKKFGLIPIFDSNLRRSFICEKIINVTSNIGSTSTVSPEPTQTDNSRALFRDYPQPQQVVMGSTAEFKCKPLFDDSVVHWLFNGKNLTILANSSRIKIVDGTLRIEQVRNGDVGNYTCMVYSASQGRDTRSAELNILQLPLPPNQINAELDAEGPAIRVFWVAGFDGNSPVTRYHVEMRTISDSKNPETDIATPWEMVPLNISGDHTSVTIPNLKPAKKYVFRVRATNKVGTGEPSEQTKNPIEIPAQPPSAPPMNVVGAPRSSNSITINWSPPPDDTQNGQLVGYKIHHRLAGYEGIQQWYDHEVTIPSQLHYTLDDLIVWQNYEIQVAAANEKGVGPFSSSTYVRTKEGKPDKSPQKVNAEAVNSTAIKIYWDPPPPQHINGINQGYNVQAWYDVTRAKLAKGYTVTPNPVPSTHFYIIDRLTPFTDYYISVSCYTSAGDGPVNENVVSVKTKQDLPEAVQSLEFVDVLDKSLKVVWKPPKQANGILERYTLEYHEASSEDNKISKEFPAEVSETKITDLTPQTAYVFRIYAHTSIGQGPVKINQTQTSIPPVLPHAPTNLAYSNIGPTSVMIQFRPGFDGNASIEKWIAEAQIVDQNSDWSQVYVSTNHTQADAVVVRNLLPFTRYRIRLTPANVVGKSTSPSSPSPDFQTLQMQPERPPDSLSAKSITSTSIRVQWIALQLYAWRGHPRGYNISWSEVDSSISNSSIITDTSADEYIIKDLEEFTEYSIKISALNDVGSSSSTKVTEKTLEDVPSASPTNFNGVSLTPTSIQLDWEQVPEKHRNGIIQGYRIRYNYSATPESKLRYIPFNATELQRATLIELTPYTLYYLTICAVTSVGDGVYSNVLSVQTLEGLPGPPTNLSYPSVTKTSARILWDVPDSPNGEILNYHVSYRLYEPNSREIAAHNLSSGERSLKVSSLEPYKAYMFTVMAKTKEGWGAPATIAVYTTDLELRVTLPFYRESWFVILCACLSIVITIIITAILFIQNKSYKYQQEAIKSSSSQDRLGDAGFTIDDHDNNYHPGFGLLAQNSAQSHRRSNATLSSNVNGLSTLKSPPRPHPGSVAYSDEEGDDDVFEDLPNPKVMTNASSNYDSSGESLTEKPSEISSTGPEDESDSEQDDEYVNMANKHFVNHYANVNGTLRGGQQSAGWKKNAKSYVVGGKTKPKLPQRSAPSIPLVPNMPSTSANSALTNGNSVGQSTDYDTTDRPNTKTLEDESERKELDSPIVNLNGGRIIVDNMAGSRAPLPGFTSFV